MGRGADRRAAGLGRGCSAARRRHRLRPRTSRTWWHAEHPDSRDLTVDRAGAGADRRRVWRPAAAPGAGWALQVDHVDYRDLGVM